MTVLLGPSHIAMVAKGVSAIVASRDAALRPSIMRAVGSHISGDGQEVTVYLRRSQSEQLLQDIAHTGEIAVVFSVPSTHQTLQLKARRATQREAKERAVGIGPARQQRGVEPASGRAAGQVERGAGQRLFADLHVRHDLVAGEHALDQQLQLAAAGLLAEHAGLDHACVVEHQQVARLQQVGQFAEDAVGGRGGAPVQQARAAALGGRVLGDEQLGQLEVEVAQGEGAGCGGGRGHAGLEGRTGPFQGRKTSPRFSQRCRRRAARWCTSGATSEDRAGRTRVARGRGTASVPGPRAQ